MNSQKGSQIMKNLGGHFYPETAAEIVPVFESRKERASHPSGKTDGGGRWYPSDNERASCCNAIRSPSRAHPYSYMVHCRTKKHIETWYNEHVVRPRRASIAPIGLGAGFGFGSYPIYTQPNPTLEQLKTRRAECLKMALVSYRMERTRHERDTVSRDYWRAQRRYWTDQVYHAQGEIMARENPPMPDRYDTGVWDTNGNQIS